MAAWAGSAAAEIRTLKSEQESLQERVRRLEKTSKTKSATGEAKKKLEVAFQTPRKTATTSGATNQDSGTQTPGSGSRRWRR